MALVPMIASMSATSSSRPPSVLSETIFGGAVDVLVHP